MAKCHFECFSITKSNVDVSLCELVSESVQCIFPVENEKYRKNNISNIPLGHSVRTKQTVLAIWGNCVFKISETNYCFKLAQNCIYMYTLNFSTNFVQPYQIRINLNNEFKCFLTLCLTLVETLFMLNFNQALTNDAPYKQRIISYFEHTHFGFNQFSSWKKKNYWSKNTVDFCSLIESEIIVNLCIWDTVNKYSSLLSVTNVCR